MKDAFNPYVVSGIQTIINLLEKVSNANVIIFFYSGYKYGKVKKLGKKYE
jgi:hypothetical protein